MQSLLLIDWGKQGPPVAGARTVAAQGGGLLADRERERERRRETDRQTERERERETAPEV